MKEMRSKAVVVLVNSKTGDWEKMPMPVRVALAKPEMGSLIPRMAVFDKNSETALGSLAYKQIGDKNAMRTLENAMREYAKNGSTPGGEDDGKEAEMDETPSKLGKGGEISDTELAEWTSAKGTKLKARAIRYLNGKLTLIRENGTSVQVTLAQLSAESRMAAEELIGE